MIASLSMPDLAVLVGYLLLVVVLGAWMSRRSGDTDAFMAAGRAMPGWAIGLSMFGSYISSISFLANPGKSFASNFNALVFSIATPIAAVIAAAWIVPFFRRSGEISAYEHLERRFGPWARTYAVACFLLTQVARMATIVYLLALAVQPLVGWSVPTIILLTGALMTTYTALGGMRAVVWVGVMQSAVLIVGPLICLAALLMKVPGGLGAILDVGSAQGKFSLGPYDFSFATSTFWMVLVYGLVIHLGNFSVDQSYVQRYITARDDREARKSVLITALLYLPTAAVFFFIGTALFAFYAARPDLLGGIDAMKDPDKVFPHFIATQLPAGLAGLVVAAIFAASLDPNLNAMATLTLCDLYKRYLRPAVGERESMRVLHLSTIAWGAIGTVAAMGMIRAGNILDVWWEVSGIFAGGVLGLFLLGMISRARSSAAGMALAIGVLVIVWMTISKRAWWPDALGAWKNPLHGHMTVVVGTAAILVAGLAIGTFLRGGPAEGELAGVSGKGDEHEQA